MKYDSKNVTKRLTQLKPYPSILYSIFCQIDDCVEK